MALLTPEQQADVLQHLVYEMFVLNNTLADLDNTDLAAMIADLDVYMDTNQAAINQSIRAVQRAKSSTDQKALTLAHVTMKRGKVY